MYRSEMTMLAAAMAVLGIAFPCFASEATVTESARKIPVAAEVDVVVIGGSTVGVAAATAAVEGGAKVFLLASETSLGADLCGTLRLWPESSDTSAVPLARELFAQTPPTPMHVKRTLTRALLDKGVALLLESFPTDVLRDSQGGVAGVVIGNRSGRQAIVAKMVIDATPRATVARLAGASFRPYPAGEREFSRIVIGGAPSGSSTATARPGPSPLAWENKSFSVTEYVLRLSMPDGSYRSWAAAEQQAREVTWQKGQAFASKVLFEVPPDAMQGVATLAGPWQGAEHADLNGFQPRGVANLLVLGGCADISREAAAAILRPVAGMELGQRLGRHAAESVKGARAPAGVVVMPRGSAKSASRLEIAESLAGFPGKDAPARYVDSPAGPLPVLGEYDVVVVGAGTSGAAAGIGSARQGARTLVIEYLDHLGGVGTVGMISKNWYGNVCGFTAEVDEAVATKGKEFHGWNIEEKSEWLRKELRKAGAELWFGAMVCGAVVEGRTVRGAVVLTPEGRGVVLAKTVVDATGNADVAVNAGAAWRFMGGDLFALQGVGLPPRAPGQGYNNSDWTFVNDADALDRTRTHVVALGKYEKFFDTSPLIDSRERRSVVGEYTLTTVDIFRERAFADTICLPRDNFDSHGYTIDPLCRLAFPKRHEVIRSALPYRCLLPRGLDGILVAGLGISVHRDALPIVRTQPDVQNVGYAAGVAAAMSARQGTTVRQLDVKLLHKHLLEKQCITAAAVPAVDTPAAGEPEVAAAITALSQAKSVEDLPAMRAYAMILDAPSGVSVPALRSAHERADRPEVKVAMAEMLAILGDASGSDTLLAYLRAAPGWDKGWAFQGQANHGAGYSRLDSVILSLAAIDQKQAVGSVVEKLGLLDPGTEFSHFRAIALALEKFAEPAAAPALAKLLASEGISGHATADLAQAFRTAPAPAKAYANQNETGVRERTLRELLLAKALVACGDADGLGRRILQQYAEDVHGVYRLHARAALARTARP